MWRMWRTFALLILWLDTFLLPLNATSTKFLLALGLENKRGVCKSWQIILADSRSLHLQWTLTGHCLMLLLTSLYTATSQQCSDLTARTHFLLLWLFLYKLNGDPDFYSIHFPFHWNMGLKPADCFIQGLDILQQGSASFILDTATDTCINPN